MTSSKRMSQGTVWQTKQKTKTKERTPEMWDTLRWIIFKERTCVNYFQSQSSRQLQVSGRKSKHKPWSLLKKLTLPLSWQLHQVAQASRGKIWKLNLSTKSRCKTLTLSFLVYHRKGYCLDAKSHTGRLEIHFR